MRLARISEGDTDVKCVYGVTLLRRLGLAGWAVGNFIFFTSEDPPENILQHELAHVRQYRRMAPCGIISLGVLRYTLRWWGELLWGLIRYRNLKKAYMKISLECQARREADI